MSRPDDAVAFVTGASRGIGAAVSLACAEAGYDLALNFARDAHAANALAQRIRALGRRAIVVQADVSLEAEVVAMFARIDTEIHATTAMPAQLGNAVASIPIQRMGSAEEVAQAVLWLLSDASSYTVGSTVDVTGGR